jgi:hypothetical protein
MNDDPVELDRHRGMAEQKATELRRMLKEVEADQCALRQRREELEKHLFAAPSSSLFEVAAKARYLLQLFAATQDAADPRRQQLINTVLGELETLALPPSP